MQTFKMFDKMPQLHTKILRDIEMDEEMQIILNKYKNEEIPADVMDLKIQGDRVIYSINRMLFKLNMLITRKSLVKYKLITLKSYLPYFLENNADVLRKNIPKTQRNYILQVLNHYGHDVYIDNCDSDTHSNLLNLESVTAVMEAETEKITGYKYSGVSSNLQEVKYDPVVNQIVDDLFYNKCLRGVITKIKQPVSINRSVIAITKLLGDFRDAVKEKIYITGDEESSREKLLRSTFKTNETLKEFIKDLEGQLEKQREEMKEQLNKKLAVLEGTRETMKTIKEENFINTKKCVHESEKIMMHQSLQSETVRIELEKESKKYEEEFQKILESNMAEEKEFKAKRTKLENQVQNWLSTFDQDVGERFADWEQLKEIYDEKFAKKKELMEEMEEQEETYMQLMAEKAAEEERIRNEKLLRLIMTRSAKIIQRAWRAYRERKMARRRGKKGKGKSGKKGK